MSKTTEQLINDFARFDAANPDVYELFKRFTFEAIKAGHKNLSSKLVVERIRWETNVVTIAGGFCPKTHRELKVSNNHTRFYAIKFMIEYPHHEGFFRVRKTKAAS